MAPTVVTWANSGRVRVKNIVYFSFEQTLKINGISSRKFYIYENSPVNVKRHRGRIRLTPLTIGDTSDIHFIHQPRQIL